MAEMASFTIDHVVLLIGLSLLYFPGSGSDAGASVHAGMSGN